MHFFLLGSDYEKENEMICKLRSDCERIKRLLRAHKKLGANGTLQSTFLPLNEEIEETILN